MAGGFSGSDDELISGINVTPMVDVVLVLLVIFMIAAPTLYQAAVKVQLPKTQGAEDSPKTPLQFTLSKEGELLLGKDRLNWDDLDGKLKAMGPKIQDETALISADQATPHGTVIRLMDALRQAGLTRFGFNVETKAIGRKSP